MKVETCMYSGYRIHPGHGKRLVRVDGKVHIFLSAKAERGWKLRRNPRKITWTVLYRRKHKKGVQAEEVLKRKTRRAVKFQRPIGNTSLEALLAKRNQKPEFRKQQRDAAIKAAKEKARAEQAAKKSEKKTAAKTGAAGAAKQAKAPTKQPMPKGAGARVGGKR